MVHVLVVEAEEARRSAMGEALEAAGLVVRLADPATAEAADADVALLALDADALDVAERLRRDAPLLPLVALASRRPDAATAARLGRARLYDVLVVRGPSELGDHVQRLRDAARRGAARRRLSVVADDLIGTSQAVAQVRRYIERAAASSANVLVTGESGTGKEIVARAVHRHSDRRERAFVAVNCSAIPDTLLETELFGHERGAFTGAVARARGRFEQADGGTLFFDEIGEMSPTLQAKLLRVLQPPPGGQETTRELTPVGAGAPMQADVRLMFATHRDLPALVAAGRFREDLYQRIHVLEIHVPPLRRRREDIPLLVRHFLQRQAVVEDREPLAVDPLVLDVLAAHDFPLNVRELEAVVRATCIMKDGGDTIVLGDLPASLFASAAAEAASAAADDAAPDLRPLAEVEAEHVDRVLRHAAGNKSLAARLLGISRPALDRRLRRS